MYCNDVMQVQKQPTLLLQTLMVTTMRVQLLSPYPHTPTLVRDYHVHQVFVADFARKPLYTTLLVVLAACSFLSTA